MLPDFRLDNKPTVIKTVWANNICWRGYGEKGILLPLLGERKLLQPLWRTVWRFLKKLKEELSYNPAIPLLGIYLEKNMVQKDTPMFTAVLFTIAKTWKQKKVHKQINGQRRSGVRTKWNRSLGNKMKIGRAHV